MTENFNVYELLYMARQKDETALQLLIEQFQPIFYKTYYQLKPFWSFLDFDECYQAYLIGLNNALYYYREDKFTKFGNFVYLCTTREIKAVIRRESAKKDSVFFSATSLDKKLNDSDDIYMIDTISDYSSDPLRIIKANALEKEAFRLLDKKVDKEILQMRLQGYSYKQISNKIGCTNKTVDNSLQRIKKKIHCLFD